MGDLLTFDRALFYLVNHGWASPIGDAVFPWITRLKNFVPAIAVLIVYLAWRGGRRGRICLLAVALAVGITDPLIVRVIKPSVDRERPCIELTDARLLASRKASPSFPSAHAANTFAVAVVFAAFYRRSALIAFPFAVLVSLSRVYIGVHYPLDVVAGALLGVGTGSLAIGVVRLAGRWVPHLATGPPRLSSARARAPESAPPGGGPPPPPRA